VNRGRRFSGQGWDRSATWWGSLKRQTGWTSITVLAIRAPKWVLD